MDRDRQLYNAIVILADMIGERVAEHMKSTGPVWPPEELALTTEEAAELYYEWERECEKKSQAKRQSKKSEQNSAPDKSLVVEAEVKGECHQVDTKRRLIPLTQWGKYHDYPNTSGLRHLVFHAQSNGFDKVIRRVGRRILLDEQAFYEWVDEHNEVVSS